MSYNDDTQWISTFTLAVTSTSDKVYANGRHQVEISVGVTAQDGEEITDEQLESIRLVRLDEDGEYQELSGELQSYSERDERFDFFQDPDFTAQTEALESAALRKVFYVSSARPGETLDTLCAVIVKDEDVQYASNGSAFEAVITLESIAPPSLTRDDFMLLANSVRDQAFIEAGANCELYSVVFANPQLRVASSTPHGAEEGIAYYQNNIEIPAFDDEGEVSGSRYQNFSHYAYATGGEKEFTFQDTAISLHTVPASMSFVRLRTTTESPQFDAHHEPSRWELLDQYGNACMIEMTSVLEGAGLDFVIYE